MHAWAFLSLVFLLSGALSTGYFYYQRNLYRDNGMALAAFTNELFIDNMKLDSALDFCRQQSGHRAL